MEELHTDSIDGGQEASYGARSRARERAYSNTKIGTIHSPPPSKHLSMESKPGASPSQAKRKASAGASPGNRRPKKRSTQACQGCRARKIRCNLISQGAPCTKCRRESIKCVIPENKRQRGRMEKIMEKAMDFESHQDLMRYDDEIDESEEGPEEFGGMRDEEVFGEDLNVDANKSYQTGQPDQLQVAPRLPFLGFDANVFHQIGVPLSSPNENYSYPRLERKTASITHLPDYIQPLPARFGADDVEFLAKRGALSIPGTRLRNALLKSYVEFLHPSMPILDLYELLESIEQPNKRVEKVSLLLFQAVMFAGIACVDEAYLVEAGYTNRKVARGVFFQKLRLLYDFDCEADSITLLQVLLLMTDWYETPDEEKNTRHWMSLAVSLAQRLDLHRSPDLPIKCDRKQKLRKRIWWACCMRDWLISLAMRRPTYIKKEDYDISMPSLDDCFFAALPESFSCISMDCTFARDIEKQRQLSILWTERAKLCVCICHVLSVSYAVLKDKPQGAITDQGRGAAATMLGPKPNIDPRELISCDAELQKWMQELPEAAHRSFYTAESLVADPAFNVHLSLLHMIFYATLSTLHRPQASTPPNSAAKVSPNLIVQSGRYVQKAATEITNIAAELNSRNLNQYLPTTAITTILPAIIFHLVSMKDSTNTEALAASRRSFDECMHVMDTLRGTYQAADISYGYLEAAIQKILNMAPPNVASQSGDQNRTHSMSGELPMLYQASDIAQSSKYNGGAALPIMYEASDPFSQNPNDTLPLEPLPDFSTEDISENVEGDMIGDYSNEDVNTAFWKSEPDSNLDTLVDMEALMDLSHFEENFWTRVPGDSSIASVPYKTSAAGSER